MSKKIYWMLFVGLQVLGATLASLSNWHTNPIVGILGLMLLLPGVLIFFLFHNVPELLLAAVTLVLNAGSWHLLRGILGVDSK